MASTASLFVLWELKIQIMLKITAATMNSWYNEFYQEVEITKKKGH
jgi:hypothetical protein